MGPGALGERERVVRLNCVVKLPLFQKHQEAKSRKCGSAGPLFCAYTSLQSGAAAKSTGWASSGFETWLGCFQAV